MLRRPTLVAAGAMLLASGVGSADPFPLWAELYPLHARKLIVISRPDRGTGKIVFSAQAGRSSNGLSRFGFDALPKPPGNDPAQISARMSLVYEDGQAHGTLSMPQGSHDGVDGWATNDEFGARYVNRGAPAGESDVKLLRIKQSESFFKNTQRESLRLVARGVGDPAFDIVTPGAPTERQLLTGICITNDGQERCHCSDIRSCDHKVTGGGAGAKLVCRPFRRESTGGGDAGCHALCPPGTGFVDLGDTVLDTCRGLEWEKKVASEPSLHAVDRTYSFAEFCSISGAPCQPSTAAATACRDQVEPFDLATADTMCRECDTGEGVCEPHEFGGDSVWEWLVDVNASVFAGHTDWRLPYAYVPTNGAPGTLYPGELNSLVDPNNCPTNRTWTCIDPIFGPAKRTAYGSATCTGIGCYTVVGDNRAWSTDEPLHRRNAFRVVR